LRLSFSVGIEKKLLLIPAFRRPQGRKINCSLLFELKFEEIMVKKKEKIKPGKRKLVVKKISCFIFQGKKISFISKEYSYSISKHN